MIQWLYRYFSPGCPTRAQTISLSYPRSPSHKHHSYRILPPTKIIPMLSSLPQRLSLSYPPPIKIIPILSPSHKHYPYLILSPTNIIPIRKRPKFRFGSAKILPNLFVIQFHAHLQYTGIKWTDYAILCNKSFSQSQQNSTIQLHISTTPFYVVKLSAYCGEGFYIHALIL